MCSTRRVGGRSVLVLELESLRSRRSRAEPECVGHQRGESTLSFQRRGSPRRILVSCFGRCARRSRAPSSRAFDRVALVGLNCAMPAPSGSSTTRALRVADSSDHLPSIIQVDALPAGRSPRPDGRRPHVPSLACSPDTYPGHPRRLRRPTRTRRGGECSQAARLPREDSGVASAPAPTTPGRNLICALGRERPRRLELPRQLSASIRITVSS